MYHMDLECTKRKSVRVNKVGGGVRLMRTMENGVKNRQIYANLT